MAQEPNITDNVLRVLRYLGLEKHLAVEALGPDERYVILRACDFMALEYMTVNGWSRDPGPVSRRMHGGSRCSFREPGGVRPALQMSQMWDGVTYLDGETPVHYFLADLDAEAPNLTQPFQSIKHGIMALWHKVSGSKTDQRDIARMLDKRLGPEA